MFSDFSYKYWRIPLHLLFWLCLAMVYVLFFGNAHDNYQFTITFVLLLMPIIIMATYFISYYLIPRYLLKKRYGKFFLYSLYTFIMATDLNMLVVVGSFAYLANYKYANMNPFTSNIVFLSFALLFTIFVVTSIKLLKFRNEEEQRVKDLKNMQLETALKLRETELKLLKGQIHPHFLFNTLNNLYGLALEQSKELPEYMIQLSDMLNYLLYSGKKEQVPISEEIQLIKNYIALEELRYEDRIEMHIQIPNELPNLSIHPFILFPFVENAFKHGFTNDNKELFLKIVLSYKQEKLHFSIENSVPAIKKDFHGGGIGLENLRQRLDMIYNGHYSLEINEHDNKYVVNLSLIIKEQDL